VTSADANLTVGTAPAISIPPANQSVLEGMPATFTATVTGQGLSFQWQKDGANILGATSATLVYYPAITDHNAKFRLKVTNFAGNVTSADAILSVVPTSAVYDNTIPGPLNTVNVKAEYGTQSDVTRKEWPVEFGRDDQLVRIRRGRKPEQRRHYGPACFRRGRTYQHQ
jgi:hypothetical protein